MPPARLLRRDPIQEAVIDFRAGGATTLSDAAAAASVVSALSDRFPKHEERRKFETRIELKSGKFVTENQDEGFFGVFLSSQDDQTVAQFRRDGFTLNRLKPYTGWATLLPLVLDLWDAYVSVAHPDHVARVALRYINRLDLSLEAGKDFSSYLRSAPEIPPELPQEVAGFQTRVTIVQPDGSMANIIQTLEQSSTERMVILLDIDAYRNGPMPVGREAIRPILESLREFKNRVFFESVTETTLRFYE
jgi:uncharacterized protein (TIGR04255 family)